MKSRKMRYRLDELKAKKISQLRDVATTLQVNIRSCIDKSEVIERLIASGKIEVTEGVPTVMKTLEEFEAMGVGELRRLLLSFGLSDEGAIEKRELRSRLLESGRIIIEGGDDMKVGGGSGSGGYNSGGYGTPSGYSNGHDPYSGGSYSNGGYSGGGYSTAGYTNGHDPCSSISSSGGGSSSGGVGVGSSSSSNDHCDDGVANGYDGVNVGEDGEMMTNGNSDHTTHASEQLSGGGSGGSGGGSKRSYNNDDNDDNDDYIHINNDPRGNVGGGGGGGVYDSTSSPYSFVASPNSPAKSLREVASQKIASSHDQNQDHDYDKVDTSASTAMIIDNDEGDDGKEGKEGKYTRLHQNNPTSTSTPPRSQHTSIPYPSSPSAMSVGSASSRTNNNRMATTSDTPLPPSSSVNSSSSSSSPSPVAFFGSNVSPSSSSSSPYTRTPS